ncbi:MAG: 1-phosphofructokinase family hexose kinase [Verrucomicrobiales bacterium]
MPKIVTLTLNPALDKGTRAKNVAPERKLRCGEPTFEPGGGGVNVATAVHRLGGDTVAGWTSGGFVGKLFGSLLDEKNLPHHPIQIAGTTRENFAVFEESSEQQFRFCLPGARLSEEEIQSCVDWLQSIDPVPEFLVLSGSLPPDSDDRLYARMAEAVASSCRVVVDTSGPPLRKAVDGSIFMIKPNIRELGQMVDRSIEDDDEIHEVARSLIEEGGIEVVLTSLGSGGAVLTTAEIRERIPAPTVKIRSKIGAGDSTVAGVVLALARGQSVPEAARFGIAAGAAAVMTEGTELCRRKDTENLYRRIIADGS